MNNKEVIKELERKWKVDAEIEHQEDLRDQYHKIKKMIIKEAKQYMSLADYENFKEGI